MSGAAGGAGASLAGAWLAESSAAQAEGRQGSRVQAKINRRAVALVKGVSHMCKVLGVRAKVDGWVSTGRRIPGRCVQALRCWKYGSLSPTHPSSAGSLQQGGYRRVAILEDRMCTGEAKRIIGRSVIE